MTNSIQKRISLLVIVALCISLIPLFPSSSTSSSTANANSPVNKTMVQYFEWYVPNDGNHWNRVAQNAVELKNMGISALWLPPAYKGAFWGDVGYGVYDMFDLGEFDTAKLSRKDPTKDAFTNGYPYPYNAANTKDNIRTKYGTKAELEAAITALHNNGIAAFADSVMNHRILGTYPNGDHALATVNLASRCDLWGNRSNCDSGGTINTFVNATFPARGGKYNTATLNKDWANGADWACDSTGNTCGNIKKNDGTTNAAALFSGRSWNTPMDGEFGNFDYLMGSNMDFTQPFVMDHYVDWHKWMMTHMKFDGFRIDAVKHIKFDAVTNKAGSGIIDRTRRDLNNNFFAVGEYWNQDLNSLVNYLNATNWKTSLFDVPLHYKFFYLGKGGFDLRNLNTGNLANINYGMNAVTFVENHDTQFGQMLLSPVADWAKPLGYAYILTRQEGFPMLFYADMYGYEHRPAGSSNGTLGSKEGVKGNLYDTIKKLMIARTKASYGNQNDYFDDGDVVGFSREGNSTMVNSGSATVLCDHTNCGAPGNPSTTLGKWMFVGTANGGKTFKNVLGTKTVTIPTNGWAFFPTEGNASVYINSVHTTAAPSPMYFSATATATPVPTATPAPTATPVPAVTATPGAVATPTPNAISNQTITVYYKNSGTRWSLANMHFQNSKDKIWTASPGSRMTLDASTGFYRISVTIPDQTSLIACFNNGTTWDNNNGLNYTLNGNSTITVNAGKVSAGAPPTIETVAGPTPTPPPTTVTSVSISLSVSASTVWGETVAVVGDYQSPTTWNVTKANLLSNTGASIGQSNTWTGKITVPANKTINFKLVKINNAGAVSWEAITGNRIITVTNVNPTLQTLTYGVK